MSTSFIKKFILPKEIDFLSALNEHAMVIKKITDDLHKCFLTHNEKAVNQFLKINIKQKRYAIVI